MPNAICPACSTEFSPRGHSAAPGVFQHLLNGGGEYRSPERKILDDSRVRCPTCSFEFPSDAVRFLGVFSPRAAWWILFLFAIGLVAFVVWAGIFDGLKP